MVYNPKVSIIVPVYNSEPFIKKCLDSIVGQSYRNIEIIIVNDGSTDNSNKIISNYAEKEKRIKHINQENKGPSLARNVGLDIADGDVIIFLDSDDYFDTRTVEILMSKFNDDIDMILYPYIREYNKRKEFIPLFKKNEIIFETREIESNLIGRILGPINDAGKINVLEMNRLNPCCMKAYKREILEEVRFVDTAEIWMEDGWFVVNALTHVKGNVLYTSDVIYHYNKANEKSFLHTYDPNQLKKRWNLYRKELEFIENNYMCRCYRQNIANRIVFELYEIAGHIVNSHLGFIEKIRKMKDVLEYEDYVLWFKEAEIYKTSLFWRSFYYLCQKRWASSIVFLLTIALKILNFRKSII